MNARSASMASPSRGVCTMSPATSERLDEVVYERVDAPRRGRAEQVHGLLRQPAGIEHAGPHGVVDVVVDVRDAVDDADDAPLERSRRRRTGVVEDAVARLQRQVQPAPVALQAVDDAQRVLVVAEALAGAGLQRRAQGLLAGVPERRVAEIVAERDRLRQVLVQPQGACDGA